MYTLSMFFFFFKQKTAYEMRISDWSSDVCSSDLPASDLYSLGAVMFQLLVGTAPFNNPELPLLFRAIRNQPAPGVRELRPDIPQAVADIVARDRKSVV